METLKSNFEVYSFSSKTHEKEYSFDVLKMLDSVMIVVTSGQLKDFTQLAMGVMNPIGGKHITTNIMGSFDNDFLASIVSMLSKKLKKTVYLSLNQPINHMEVPVLTKLIVNEIEKSPECF
ncbi:PREDICTED: uncharacterized protein LOC108567832 [Nicrophorus vespilloides]|uniref:Uncharacterized protein LOC108567832 n=1 Tax=Nicrophorus vespilloides TaxID=110193 RepID=A0ABM1NB15_NICVS|nr:PREDICTED: uncharacterized protein LOC108567832 [Nicrophorus vespilloides]